eukprot:3053032-Lingulodinium_polyedra.AAC.1
MTASAKELECLCFEMQDTCTSNCMRVYLKSKSLVLELPSTRTCHAIHKYPAHAHVVEELGTLKYLYNAHVLEQPDTCLLYTSPSPRDA